METWYVSEEHEIKVVNNKVTNEITIYIKNYRIIIMGRTSPPYVFKFVRTTVGYSQYIMSMTRTDYTEGLLEATQEVFKMIKRDEDRQARYRDMYD